MIAGGRAAQLLCALWLAAFAASLISAAPALAGLQSLLLLSIHAGFPFGYYRHAPAMGPRLLEVPYAVAAGYPVLGYFGWTLARLLVRAVPDQRTRATLIATPLAAALILTGYDLAYDPIGAAARGLWTFRHPGGQFGSPLSNYLGWLVTGWTFFQLFALLEGRFVRPALPRTFWLLPCIVWGAMALQFAALLARASPGSVTVGGRVFVVADIYEAGLITALLTMLFAALAAAARLWTRDAQ